ncbi:MAG: TonB-dependent receptor [Bradyrhizobium sp.]|nr:TonB-dependent receptor [Bradyrhizobium sp.]
MRFLERRILLAAGASWLALGATASAQSAPTALPDVNVTAPSPIVKRKPAVVHRPARVARAGTGTSRGRAPQAEPAPVPAVPTPQQGVLPVVTDQFATVTVVPNEEIRRHGGGTLGDLLFSKPGITGSEFAPGASSRPIIRGLDVNRVGIVENGVGGNGASDLGEDHFVPIDPLSTNQVEVIRGPATLRYGSTAIGGVVSATNNRIPDALPSCAAAPPFQSYGLPAKAPPLAAASPGCVTAETRTAVTSVDRGVESAVLLDAGGGNFAVHADAFGRKAGDYNVPSYPFLTDPNLPFSGRQPNSASQAYGGSVGGSYIFDGGFIGAAITQHNALYHIPGIEGTELLTRIDGKQTKFTSKGEYRPDNAVIDAIRFWAGATDYKHNEIGFEDPGVGPLIVHQTFTNKEQEGRAEVQFAPFNVRFAALTTAVGVQASHQKLTAPSPEDPDSPINGLFDPNKNTKVAGYIFNEFKFSDVTKAQIAGRIENASLSGTAPAFVPDVFDLNVDPNAIGPATAVNRNFTPKSGSIGLIQNLPWDLVASITGQYVERAPKPAELFSRGVHEATGTFDIGDPNLRIETAKSIEAGLRRATGPFRFELTGYYTKFGGFIYRRLTGNTCEDGACQLGPGLELNQAVYSQRDATFRGGEFQFQYDVMPVWNGLWGIEGQYDIVRATFDDGTNVPRIPPQRLGGGVYYRDANWFARVNLLHAFAQNDIAPIAETPTSGYNLLRAEVSYKTKLDSSWFGAREMHVGLVGNNLLNENIRNAVSYNKDQVLLPGIGVRAFANLKF